MELIEVILSKENLNRAYKKVVANKGASGVDGVTVEELGDYIRENREKIVTSLRNRTYIPKPVRRVYIPKDNGKKRPLGIPTALDRTIQQAIAQPISDIYEEIFSDYSYGFRAGRSCHDAIRQALEYLNDGYEWVVDIDIEQFFDKVNHDKLIQILREQVNDSTTLNLIRKYLKAGVMENGLEKATITGVPQGSVISPLLANIYLNTLDRLWEKYGLTHGILVRYADDTVIICKNKKSANHALNLLQYIMAKLDLKLHPVKTKIISMWDGKEGFDFLGMHHRRMTTETRKGQLYKEAYQYPSRKAMKKMKAEVKRNVNRRSLLVAKEEDLIKNLNPKITGWKNYYSTKRNKKWMQALDWYIICTFTRWYNKKHQRRNRMSKVGFVRNSIYEKGLKKMARA
jgi:RNA-directed DNA polymerase